MGYADVWATNLLGDMNIGRKTIGQQNRYWATKVKTIGRQKNKYLYYFLISVLYNKCYCVFTLNKIKIVAWFLYFKWCVNVEEDEKECNPGLKNIFNNISACVEITGPFFSLLHNTHAQSHMQWMIIQSPNQPVAQSSFVNRLVAQSSGIPRRRSSTANQRNANLVYCWFFYFAI